MSRSNTVYNFAKHCITDSEFNCGGIPTKEDYYLKKLGWDVDCEELHKFYDAMWTIKCLNDEGRKAK